MGRAPCCDKGKVRKGPWSIEEDALLRNFIMRFGNGGNWISLPKKAGLNRCGKSCRLRWLNYLRPGINHGDFTEEEDHAIYTLYHTIGSRWSLIASNLPGRTDNDVKNYWNTKLKRKITAGKFKNFDPTNNTFNYPKISTYTDTLNQSQRKSPEFENNGDQILTMEEIVEEKEGKNSSMSHAICSHAGSSSSSSRCYDNQNSSSYASIMSELSLFDDQSRNDDQDEFWMDLLSESFDDVKVSIQLEDKIIEIASLLGVN